MSAYDQVVDMFALVHESWTIAQNKATETENRLNTAMTAASADLSMAGPASVSTDVSVVEPSVLIPTEAEGPDLTFYQTLVQDAIDKLSGLFSDYIATYFPTDNDTNAAAEAWLQEMLTDGSTGMLTAVEQQMWVRDHNRIMDAAGQAQDAVLAEFAAKGFPMPPGAAVMAVLLVQQKAQDELSQSSNAAVLAHFEAFKLALDKAIQLRQVAMSSAGQYIGALAQSLTVGHTMAISKSEAQNHLIAAAADYYRARQSAKELALKKDVTNAGFLQDKYKEDLHADEAVLGEKVKVAIQGAELVSRLASAALNNLHANASAGVSASSGMSVGYQYSNDTSSSPPSVTSV